MATPPEVNPYAPPVADCRPGAGEFDADQLDELRTLLKKTREGYGALAVAWGTAAIGLGVASFVYLTYVGYLNALFAVVVFAAAAVLTWRYRPSGVYLGAVAGLLVVAISSLIIPPELNLTYVLLPVLLHAVLLMNSTWRLRRAGVDVRP